MRCPTAVESGPGDMELVSEPLALPPSGVAGRKRAARLSRDGGDRVTIAADATSMTTSHPREFLTMTPMRTTPPGPASDMGSTIAGREAADALQHKLLHAVTGLSLCSRQPTVAPTVPIGAPDE